MRFRTKERPRGQLKPRDQKRLTMLIGGLGVIMICFTVVRRPEFWAGLFPETPAQQNASDDATNGSISADQVQAAESSVVPGEQGVSDDSGDVKPDNTLRHDEFLIGDEARSAVDSANVISMTTRRIEFEDVAESPDGKTAVIDPNVIPRVPERLIRDVRDNVIGVHSSESEAYFMALKMASVFAERKMDKAPAGAYALFMDSPNSSRGIAWNIRGKLRMLSIVKGQINAVGVGTIYDAWISTEDSGENLVHAVSMNADPQLMKLINSGETTRKFGLKEAPSVKFTGYFFKVEGYASGAEGSDGISLAPLFVAGSIREIPKASATTTRADALTPYLGWLAVIVCAAMFIILWSFSLSDAAHSQTRAHQLTKLPAVVNFDDVTSVTVVETLNQLELAAQRPSAKLDHL